MTTAAQALANYATIDDFPCHPDYGGIRGFLLTCEVRDRFDGVTFFGSGNCNYILFPSGLLLANYGYNGRAVMSRIREHGADAIETDARTARAELRQILAA